MYQKVTEIDFHVIRFILYSEGYFRQSRGSSQYVNDSSSADPLILPNTKSYTLTTIITSETT